MNEPMPTQRTMLQGVALARWGTWAWLAATAVLQRADLIHPAVAALLVSASGLWAVATTALLRARPRVLLTRRWAMGEFALAWLLLTADGYVFAQGHTTAGAQNLAATWPLVAIMAAASSRSPLASGIGGFAVATGRVFGALLSGEQLPRADRVVSFAATAVFYCVAGVVWAAVTQRLRVVETEVAARRAREDVARTLHDGVLQTLALVERRTATSDPELAAVARASDRELRAWLYGARADSRDGLEARLRQVADRVASGYDLDITVNVLIDDEPRQAVGDGLVGALGEALTNAAKHAEAKRVVLYVEQDDDGALFATVRDDGRGMDPASARAAGRGIVRSIDERVAALGGRVELVSETGGGTEVRVWLP